MIPFEWYDSNIFCNVVILIFYLNGQKVRFSSKTVREILLTKKPQNSRLDLPRVELSPVCFLYASTLNVKDGGRFKSETWNKVIRCSCCIWSLFMLNELHWLTYTCNDANNVIKRYHRPYPLAAQILNNQLYSKESYGIPGELNFTSFLI